jgi:hypothetical protein
VPFVRERNEPDLIYTPAGATIGSIADVRYFGRTVSRLTTFWFLGSTEGGLPKIPRC